KQKNTTPVIIITAYTSKEIREKCFIAGCNEFLTKPVLPNKLIKVISKYFYQSRHTYITEESFL
ncbi:MAG TPA: hypothetical protein DD405_04885, partial [Desulfobacteraceae bacterium]|nr:hypothetical protein [Desulfobacteraceae bacterium]